MSITPFKYAEPTPNSSIIDLNDAETIEGFTSLMWVERYRDAGEFTIIAPVSSGLRSKLPIGSFISHVGTQELMVVESHEISDNIDGDVDIVITGRSFETFMEQRIIAYDATGVGGTTESSIASFYFTGAARPDAHVVELIDRHMYAASATLYPEKFENVRTVSVVPALTGVSTSRELPIKDLYSSVLELLAIDDLGIKSVRPGPYSGLPSATDLGFIIHKGVDLRSTVAFSHESGDLRNGQYLWTNKKKKTVALTQGPNYRTFVGTNPANRGLNVRVGYVDAKEIAADRTYAAELGALNALGTSYLGMHKEASIVRIEVTPTTNRLRYRTDYNVGDLVGVTGNYDTQGIMRVVEHVEIIDKTGQASYPTLEAI